ncbi:MAG: hypothetical protein BWX45_01107 [Deltaproteobacteria bacterium ADurb.Bin002]|nr:MAG: hypothetical protein BWX45_01107 [Deltaproteobacteria bacterium ADurb.Bin002]
MRLRFSADEHIVSRRHIRRHAARVALADILDANRQLRHLHRLDAAVAALVVNTHIRHNQFRLGKGFRAKGQFDGRRIKAVGLFQRNRQRH